MTIEKLHFIYTIYQLGLDGCDGICGELGPVPLVMLHHPAHKNHAEGPRGQVIARGGGREQH